MDQKRHNYIRGAIKRSLKIKKHGRLPAGTLLEAKLKASKNSKKVV